MRSCFSSRVHHDDDEPRIEDLKADLEYYKKANETLQSQNLLLQLANTLLKEQQIESEARHEKFCNRLLARYCNQ